MHYRQIFEINFENVAVEILFNKQNSPQNEPKNRKFKILAKNLVILTTNTKIMRMMKYIF